MATQGGRLVIWWMILLLAWWALVGEWSTSDLAWGVVVSLLASLAGVFVTSAGMVRGAELGAAMKVAPSVALAVILDFGVIVAVLATALRTGRRDTTGVFCRRQVPERDAA